MKDQNEAEQFITGVLCGLWPRWEPKDVELAEWKKRLMPFDYYLGKQAVNDYFFESQKRNIEPPAGKIINILSKRAFIRRQQQKRIAPILVICNQDGKQVWFPFSGDINIARQNYEGSAENRKNEANRLFPNEKHFVHWFNTDEPEEDTGYYGPDAKQRAMDSILARRDDDKTKIWLQRYLSKKRKALPVLREPKKVDEPVPVGDVIEDDIPF